MKENEKTKNGNELKFVVGTRGKTFEGTVIKKFEKRAVVEFERTVKVIKYERFMRKKTRIHSRIPTNLQVHVGDYVKVQECRPLSKMIHSIIIKVLKHTSVEGKSK